MKGRLNWIARAMLGACMAFAAVGICLAEVTFLYAGGNRSDGLHVIRYQVEGAPVKSSALKAQAQAAWEKYKANTQPQFDVEFYNGRAGVGTNLMAIWSRRPDGRVVWSVFKKDIVTE